MCDQRVQDEAGDDSADDGEQDIAAIVDSLRLGFGLGRAVRRLADAAGGRGVEGGHVTFLSSRARRG
jgi:hypothetical protein